MDGSRRISILYSTRRWISDTWYDDERLKRTVCKMMIIPIFQRKAFEYIDSIHRHHVKPVGSLFQIGLERDGKLIGVAVVGRPVARRIDHTETCEVTRMCTDGTKNACSKLYGACARIAREMGYKKIITYILETESGISLRASGWKFVHATPGKSWSVPSRPRTDKHPIGVKHLYEKPLI